MRPSELGTWAALYNIDPFDEERADLRAGIVASTLANIHRGKNTEPLSPFDFMWGGAERKKQQTANDLKNFLMGKSAAKAPASSRSKKRKEK